jgi:hypothetical protein
VAKHVARLVVYTALVGGEEHLREQPVASASSADFVCLTDDPGLRSDTWQVVVVEPRLPTDPVRSARALKILGHPTLAGYDRSLWVDNAVELRARPETFVDEWLAQADVAAPLHTLYPTALAEAEASIDLGKDDHLRVFEQLAHYVRTSPASLEANPHWTGLLARRRTARVDAAMTTWWEHVLRYSRRDQLSFGVVMAGAGLLLNSVALGNLDSPLHRWPEGRALRAVERLREPPPVAEHQPAHAARPADRVSVLRAEIEEALGDAGLRDAELWELEARLLSATANVRRLRGNYQRERDEAVGSYDGRSRP